MLARLARSVVAGSVALALPCLLVACRGNIGEAITATGGAAGGTSTAPGASIELAFEEVEPATLVGVEGATLNDAAAADLDGDGHVDVVAAMTGASGWIAFGDGDGGFSIEALDGWPGTLRRVLAVDLDGDGDVDLVGGAAGEEGQRDDVLLLNDGGSFTDATPASWEPDDTSCLAAGDLDGDGHLDLVFGNDTPDEVPLRIYLGDGAGGFARADKEPTGSYAVASAALADVDGDGDLDLLLATSAGPKLFLYQGGAWTESQLPEVTETIAAVVPSDADGDGHADLYLVSSDGQDRLLVNDGAGHFFDATLANLPFDAAAGKAAAWSDLNLDGAADLVIANAGQSRLYLGDGHGRLVDHTPRLPAHDDPSVAVAIADLDGDGHGDVVLFNATGDSRVYRSVPPGE